MDSPRRCLVAAGSGSYRVTKAEFQSALREVLSSQTPRAVLQVQLLLESIPPKARELSFEVIPGQDAEGPFDVRAALDGPDLYVLNKAIRDCSLIFGVRYTRDGLEPPVPMVDRDCTDFEVNDVIVDVVADWLQVVWREVNAPAQGIPVRIVGHDDYGTTTPRPLRG
jgi:hypothetical protein